MTVPKNEFLEKAEAQGIENGHDLLHADAAAFQAVSKKYGKNRILLKPHQTRKHHNSLMKV